MLQQHNFKQIFVLVLFALNCRIVNSEEEKVKQQLIQFYDNSKYDGDNEPVSSYRTFYNCGSFFCKSTIISYLENDYICTLGIPAKKQLCLEVFKTLILKTVILRNTQVNMKLEDNFEQEPCLRKKIQMKNHTIIEHPMMKCSLSIKRVETDQYEKYLLYYISRTYRKLGVCGKYKILNCKMRNFYVYQELGEVKRVKDAWNHFGKNSYEVLSSSKSELESEKVELIAETYDIDFTKLKDKRI